MVAKVEFEIYHRKQNHYAPGSDGFLERYNIFAGFLEAGSLVKESAVLWYIKLSRNVNCLFVLFTLLDDQLT